MFDDRIFVKVETNELGGVSGESDAKLFQGLTQENVEMNRQMRIEEKGRIDKDNDLQAQINQCLTMISTLTQRITSLEKRVKALENT